MGHEMTKSRIQAMFAYWDYFPPKSSIGLMTYKWHKGDKKIMHKYINIKKRGVRDYSINTVGYGEDFTNKKDMMDELWDMIKTNWEGIPELEKLKLNTAQ